jgi:uncharacterized protein YprB with RNaseH-like and TPR domain
MSNLIYFKVDTTGTDIANDRVVLISALKVEGEERTTFHRYILPKGNWKMSPDATEVNGLTEEFIRENGEDPVKVFTEFNEFISSPKGFDLVTFNGLNFDVRILHIEYDRNGLQFAATYHRMFDMYDIEARNNRNDFASTYLRHVGIDKETVTRKTPEKTPENLEKLFWRMSKDYTREQMLGNFSHVIFDLENLYRKDSNGDLVFVRGKHYGDTVYDTILKDPDYIMFLFKNIISEHSKRIIINDYEKRKKMVETEEVK